MAERKAISKKKRFEVFKRDNFTCQYCGRSAPEVILEIDHINPVKNGGDNNVMNLITSCFDCNRGKGKRKLSDNSELKLQMEQLKEINTKKEQLEMLVKWKEELENFEDEQVNKIENLLLRETGYDFSEYGKKNCKKHLKEFGFDEVYESAKISINQYFDPTDIENSTNKVFNYIWKICRNRQFQKNSPFAYEINYLCKIGENEINYFDKIKTRIFLKKYFKAGDFEILKDIFRTERYGVGLIAQLENYYGEEF